MTPMILKSMVAEAEKVQREVDEIIGVKWLINLLRVPSGNYCAANFFVDSVIRIFNGAAENLL